MSLIRSASIVGTGLMAMAFAQNASAVTIGFEQPEYVPGSLVGQQGWVSNSYNSLLGGINGTVDVSTMAPLAGAQSVLYTQTAGPGSTDVSKANVISVSSDGGSGTDLTGSVLLEAGANANGNGQIGLFLGPDAEGGTSPIGVLIEGGGSAGSSGVLYVIDNTYSAQTGGNPFRPAGTYISNSVIEFVYAVDFESASYQAAFRNVTAGDTAYTPLTGGNPDGSFQFFGGFPAEGDGTYSVDVGAFLRDGVGRIDDITLVPEPGALGLGLFALGGLALRRRRRSV